MTSLLVVDTETGGLDPSIHAIASVGLVAPWGNLHLRVADTRGSWDPRALEVNGIDPEQHLSSSHLPSVVTENVATFLEGYSKELHGRLYLAGHNVAFDIGFLHRLYDLADEDPPRIFQHHRTVDTHSILWAEFMRGELPYEATNSSGAFEHFGIEVKGRHTALGDALATKELLERLIES